MPRTDTVPTHGQTLVRVDDGKPLTLAEFYAANADGLAPEDHAEIEVDLWMFGECRFGGGASVEQTLRLVG